jgi:UrcA family protein
MLKQVMATTLLAAAVLLTAHAAQAQTEPTTKSTRVSYAGLNLADESDARVVLQRIRRAAAQVCGPDLGASAVIHSRSYMRCKKDATSNAVADLRSPLVTAIYKSGSQVEIARN